ncbi:CHAD domain-containing protein [Achromobacter marplatensis]|uniref:CHAD domain-containing protein n=1 Tax=Achromobacter marplatensis TaxID=470868 RepID=A0AA43B1G2_9BURK|nr:CHAD domain-containing protein [Achromobacter marplatensis]MDH2052068.1 CHAD domain-containing protein [Achromobacter marplatensis]
MARTARPEKLGEKASTGDAASTSQPKDTSTSDGSTFAPTLQSELQRVAEAWAGEMGARARRLTQAKAGVAAPELIHDLRVYMRRLCALSDLLPCTESGCAARRMLRKEVDWAMQPLSRARDWDVFTIETLPLLWEADSDLDQDAVTKRASARSGIAHDEMYVHLRSARFQGVLRLFRERNEDSRVAMADCSSKALYGRIRRKFERWEKALRTRMTGLQKHGVRAQHQMRIKVKRVRYANEALRQPGASRQLERFVRSLGELQAKLGDLQDLRTAARLGREVSVSLSTGKLTGRKTEKVCARLLHKAESELRVACRLFLRKPSFRDIWGDVAHPGLPVGEAR